MSRLSHKHISVSPSPHSVPSLGKALMELCSGSPKARAGAVLLQVLSTLVSAEEGVNLWFLSSSFSSRDVLITPV